MDPINLMQFVTGDFFRGDPDNEKWRGESVTWWKALPRADYDALVRERDEERHWKCFHARSAEAAAKRALDVWTRAKKAERQRDEAERVAASALEDRAKALARAERAEKALRWYAEEYNYHPWDGRDGAKDGIPALEDRGAKAREALEGGSGG